MAGESGSLRDDDGDLSSDMRSRVTTAAIMERHIRRGSYGRWLSD